MVINVTFNNISVISWWSVLLVEETGVPGENHRHVASNWSSVNGRLGHFGHVVSMWYNFWYSLLFIKYLFHHPVSSGVRVASLFWVFFCVVLLCVFTFWVPYCDIRCDFTHRNDVLFVYNSSCLYEGSCPIYAMCVCLCIVVSNTYCVVFLFCFSSSCISYATSFSGLSIFDCPFGIL